MRDDRTTGERMAALFLAGTVLFLPPMMLLFDADRLVLGVPILFLYLFLAWGALTALLALVIEGRRGHRDRDPPPGDRPG